MESLQQKSDVNICEKCEIATLQDSGFTQKFLYASETLESNSKVAEIERQKQKICRKYIAPLM